MSTLEQALEFEDQTKRFKSRDEKIQAGKKAKELILKLNEMYKSNHDESLMDVMKRLTRIKRRAEGRLYAKITV